MGKGSNANGLRRNVIGITRMTIHNGPGLRTLILFKGCPLRCLWCSTPESQNLFPELAVSPDRCFHCGQCLSICPKSAIRSAEKSITVDRKLCENCGKCVETCNAEALKMIGRPMTPDELVEEVKKDEVFFRRSRGGVTISGGEPLLSREFNLRLLRQLKDAGINVGVDTSGYVPWNDIDPLLPYVDFFLWDIKHMDAEKHRKLTGVPNALILRNAKLVSERNIPIYIRIPVIPGCNDSEENLKKTCEFARGLSSVVDVGLLPLHHLGKARYASLNREYPIDGLELIPDDALQNLSRLVESCGLQCKIIS
jgi:pyruvate formate lyase activating enzyme